MLISIFTFLIFVVFFCFKFYFSIQNTFESQINISNADITEPRFAINSSSEKILVTAKEGNFIDEDKIMLKNNVKFKSNIFSIETENVLFDRKNQTAYSENKSLFKSKNTTITSDGFNIYDDGDKIKFYGKSTLILK